MLCPTFIRNCASSARSGLYYRTQEWGLTKSEAPRPDSKSIYKEKNCLVSHYANKVPDVTITHLRHYLWNLPSTDQWRKDDVIRVPYDSNVLVYFIPENGAKTQLLSGFWPVRVLLRSLKGDSRNKAKKVAIHRLTRTRYHYRADETGKASASAIPSSVISP